MIEERIKSIVFICIILSFIFYVISPFCGECMALMAFILMVASMLIDWLK